LSDNVVDFPSRKTRIARLLGEATGGSWKKNSRAVDVLYSLISACLICTMLPDEVATSFFSILAVFGLVAFVVVCRRSGIKPDRNAIAGLILLTCVSIIRTTSASHAHR